MPIRILRSYIEQVLPHSPMTEVRKENKFYSKKEIFSSSVSYQSMIQMINY
jgi:hypothetical protein